MATEFDYVIVGAGSAGCVLANRMTEDPEVRDLLVEAGGEGRSIYVDIPSGFWVIRNNPKFDWCFVTEPDPGINSRRMVTPRGKALGGSSAINGQMYMRGHSLDYDHCAAMGAKGWSFADVLPYFRKSETFGGGGDDYRGDSGPLITTPAPLASPLYRVFLDAAEQAGYSRSPSPSPLHRRFLRNAGVANPPAPRPHPRAFEVHRRREHVSVHVAIIGDMDDGVRRGRIEPGDPLPRALPGDRPGFEPGGREQADHRSGENNFSARD